LGSGLYPGSWLIWNAHPKSIYTEIQRLLHQKLFNIFIWTDTLPSIDGQANF